VSIAPATEIYEKNVDIVQADRAEPCALCPDATSSVFASGVRDFEYGAPGEYRWLRCDHCNLVRIDPIPDDYILSLAYPDHYHAYQPHSSRFVGWYNQRRRRARAKELVKLIPNDATVLDVGCGTGSLLHEIQKLGTYELLGVEYRADAAAQAGRHGIKVWTGELEDADIPASSVDLCVMEHVIEHVRNPVETLRRIHTLLKPGGIVIGETPNVRCFDAALFISYWGGGHAPRHLWLFQPDSMKNTLRGCGYDDMTITHPVYSAHLALSMQNWLRRHRNDTDGLTCGRSWYFPLLCSAAMPLSVAASVLKQSGAIRFMARKAD